MNNRTIAITAGVVGGLVGLGVLVYYLVNEDKDEPNFDKKETEPENNHPASKLSVQKTTKQNRLVEQPAKKAAKVIPITAAVTEPNAEESKAPAPISDEFPLRLGSKGDRVERLRVWLMRNYGWTGTINDEFDEKTEGLVKKYLKKDQVDEDTFYELKMGKPVYEQTLKR